MVGMVGMEREAEMGFNVVWVRVSIAPPSVNKTYPL